MEDRAREKHPTGLDPGQRGELVTRREATGHAAQCGETARRLMVIRA